ncbi:MAG: hypothetical protein LUH16_00160 [Clostridiales bacterium]|nr:hypothetical protein [Clostridiales bacterium]
MNYEYHIAGLRVLLELPFEISVQPSSAPFLTGPTGGSPDVRFVCCPVPSRPAPPPDGHQDNTRCYAETAGERRVFFRPSPAGAPWACVTWDATQPEVLRCDYLEGQEFRLNFSMRLCDLLGLESLLLPFGGMILHCSFIRWQGRGVLFSADSGVGKSTQADLWVAHQGADVINGDRAGLRQRDGIWTACGLPYAGSSRIYRNEAAPVSAIFMLEQAKENEVRPLTPAQALRRLYPQITIHSWDGDFVQRALPLMEQLVTSVPVWLLRCLPDAEATETAKRALLAQSQKGAAGL